MIHMPPFHRILRKSVEQFSHTPADRQTNDETKIGYNLLGGDQKPCRLSKIYNR